MKFRGFAIVALFAAIFLVAANYPPTNNTQKEAILMKTLMAGLDQLHYAPRAIDDEFSEEVFEMYLERIDGNKRWLTQEDIAKLEKHRTKLDDEAKEGTYHFLNEAQELLKKGLAKTQVYYRQALAQPFDFSDTEVVELDGDKRDYAKNDEELQAHWQKTMKYETLTRLVKKIEKQEKDIEQAQENPEAAPVTIKPLDTLEAEARKSVLKLFDDWYHRMEKRKRKDYLNDYLNAFTGVFDPHTNYFLPADKENFDIGMSGRLEGIGARLQETTTDETKVVMVVPGGPAYQGKVLEQNDIIQKVAQGEDGEWEDIGGWDISDVVAKIRGKKGTKVRLTIKKVDGTIVETTIVRDEIIMDESYAKSAVLELEGLPGKIGYIKLPRFYADFKKRDGHQCSVDVAKELEKLKAANVDGIILDIRNNGGGSLRDVVDMTGFFIEEGPVVQVKSRRNGIQVLTDKDPTVQYDGPLIVMVNSFSASASEILSAALQDYNRAVIVGSDATFGKATVQRFFDLDRAIRGFSDIKPLGEVKVTTQKFYRINGSSNQLKGVIPDIVLPDNYDYIKTGEQEYEKALTWTEIAPVNHEQSVFNINNMAELKANSQQRVAASDIFTKIKANARRLEAKREQTSYSLNIDDFREHKEAAKAEAGKYDKLFDEPLADLTVENLTADLEYIHSDSSRIGRNTEFLKTISKDVYIEETLRIMDDLIKGAAIVEHSQPAKKQEPVLKN